MEALAGKIRVLALCLSALICFTILISLGNWQMERLAWKTDLIETANSRLDNPPVPLPLGKSADIVLEGLLYAPVTVRGRYHEGDPIFVYTQLPEARSNSSGPDLSAGAPGYWVFAPFQLENGETLFVNRGFQPVANERSHEPSPKGTLQLTGVVRQSEVGNYFTPSPSLDERLFFRRLPSDFATAYGQIDKVLDFYIDLSVPDTAGNLITARFDMSFRNNHFGYALTWYGLAITLVIVAVAILRSELQKRKAVG